MPVPTIPSSISLGDIQTEFTGSNPIGINEYYAGAGLVVSGTAAACNDGPVTNSCVGNWSFRNANGGVIVSQSFIMSAYASSY